MNVRNAAILLVAGYFSDLDVRLCRQLPGRETDPYHLAWMMHQVCREKFTAEKAHTWIGFVQGVLVCSGRATVEQMKRINKSA